MILKIILFLAVIVLFGKILWKLRAYSHSISRQIHDNLRERQRILDSLGHGNRESCGGVGERTAEGGKAEGQIVKEESRGTEEMEERGVGGERRESPGAEERGVGGKEGSHQERKRRE